MRRTQAASSTVFRRLIALKFMRPKWLFLLYVGVWVLFEIVTFRYSRRSPMHLVAVPFIGGVLIEAVFILFKKSTPVPFYVTAGLVFASMLVAYSIYIYPVVYEFRMK